jgi:hypothetical protein
MSELSSKKHKIAVIGSRGYNNKDRVFRVLDANRHQIKAIVSGGCKDSADELAHEWCKKTGVPILIFYAAWYDTETGLLDRGAGFRRNWDIIRQCDKVLAFWDQKSNGTRHSIEIARSLNKTVKIIDISQEPISSSKTDPQ